MRSRWESGKGGWLRSYWGGGLGWTENRGVTGDVGWAGLKTEAELLGRPAGLG